MVLFSTVPAFATSKNCKSVQQKDEMHGQKACVYYVATIEQGYEKALRENIEDASYLKAILPSKKTGETVKEVEVEYVPKGRFKYVINLRYPGGETEWTLLRSANKVTIVFDYYPD